MEFTDEEKETLFNGNNQFNPDADGISIEDFAMQKRASMAL